MFCLRFPGVLENRYTGFIIIELFVTFMCNYDLCAITGKENFFKEGAKYKIQKESAVRKRLLNGRGMMTVFNLFLHVVLVNYSLDTVVHDSNNSILLCRCSSCVVFLIASKISHQLIGSQNLQCKNNGATYF